MFQLMKLPYALDALEPYLSKETVRQHYEVHHQGYINNLNNLVKDDKKFKDKDLEYIIKHSSGKIFNNAAQVWNHNFYWYSLCPTTKSRLPDNKLRELLIKNFDSVENFKEQFADIAVNHFGAGWIWLVKESANKLKIIATNNADNPLIFSQKPLLTCDVWEHAYYIAYRS